MSATPPASRLFEGLPDDLYEELRLLAGRYVAGERRGHTLQATALVHEAYLRLLQRDDLAGIERRRLIYAAARTMRHILVDHARGKKSAKRGGGRQREDDAMLIARDDGKPVDLLAVHEALQRLETFDAELATVVELRFFGGMTEEETAAVLEVSDRTIRRQWQVARLWLANELKDGD